MEIKLTYEEAQAVLQLIDLAVKAGGMQVAKASVIISEKIASQFPKQSDPMPETQSSTNPEVPMPKTKK